MDEVTPIVPANTAPSVAAAKPNKPKKKTNPKKMLVLIVIGLLTVAVAVLGYLYYNEKKEVTRLSNPTESAQQEAKELVSKVKLLIDLPDEEPTVATVKDSSKLQSQAFFKNSQNGDKVLIYSQAKKIVLYRPETNKVIEVSALKIGDTSADTNTSQNQSQTQTQTNKNP